MDSLVDEVKYKIYKQIRENRIIVLGKHFSSCQKGYLWTNENILECLDIYDIKGKLNALCVTASGDHAFNLIVKGILNIDTFDTNNMANYIAFGLKKALILRYSYEEFLQVISGLLGDIKVSDVTEIFLDLLPYMDEEYRCFWQEIINYNYEIQKEMCTNLNLLHLLCIGVTPSTDYLKNNNYLINEDNYNLLRSRLSMANITFNNVNAINLGRVYQNSKYDIIMLSNILDYFSDIWGFCWKIDKLKEYTKELMSISNDEALIFLKYIMMYSVNGMGKSTLFDSSMVRKSELVEEEIHKVIRHDGKGAMDGVILRRVK